MQSPAEAVQPVLSIDQQRSSWPALAMATAIFAGLSLWAALTSEGFLEADACTHYLYARFAFEEPHFFVNVWGRPLCTAIYSIPAALAGRIGVRVTSLLLALACAAIAYRIARRQGYRWPALAFIFTLAQPLVFLHSFSELTELPFATLIALAFWMYQKQRWGAMAALVALSPLGRPEGFGFIMLAAAALVLHRRPWWLLVLPIPLMLWNHAGWELYGRPGPWWKWLPDNWPYAAESLYDRGNLAHFLAALPVITSPFIFPATMIGIWQSLPMFSIRALPSLSEGEGTGWHLRRCQVLIAVIPLLILIVHSLLYWLGKMASNGELRYMLVVAPFWALLSAKGWEWIFQRLSWPHPLRWAATAALLPALANGIYRVLPLTMDEDWQRARDVAAWYERSPLRSQYPKVLAAHPGIFYFLDISPSGPHVREWRKSMIVQRPSGTFLVWDPIYGAYNSDAQRSVDRDEIVTHGWIHARWIETELGETSDRRGSWSVYLSEAGATSNGRTTRSGPNDADLTSAPSPSTLPPPLR